MKKSDELMKKYDMFTGKAVDTFGGFFTKAITKIEEKVVNTRREMSKNRESSRS